MQEKRKSVGMVSNSKFGFREKRGKPKNSREIDFLYSGSLVALCPGFAKIKQNGFLSRKISPIFFVVAAGLSISPVRCCCEWFHSLCQECSSLVVAA